MAGHKEELEYIRRAKESSHTASAPFALIAIALALHRIANVLEDIERKLPEKPQEENNLSS
ncbi:hypothetical protein [Anaerolinea sp.]|uniref:hypothetical protein n=1 Tax=Anaerolinea sp. TaxID=1872519 RepID=UPI002ACE503C|nr:hypothetical protein [Anaerolinea sp.]